MPNSETTPLLHNSNEASPRTHFGLNPDSAIPRVQNPEVEAADLEEEDGSERTDRTGITEDDVSSTVGSENSPAITTRQYLIVTVLLIATLTSSFAVCLFPPFFPKIAEEKGCSATAYGFIIGTNCLTSFIVTPFIGKNVGVYAPYIEFLETNGCVWWWLFLGLVENYWITFRFDRGDVYGRRLLFSIWVWEKLFDNLTRLAMQFPTCHLHVPGFSSSSRPIGASWPWLF